MELMEIVGERRTCERDFLWEGVAKQGDRGIAYLGKRNA